MNKVKPPTSASDPRHGTVSCYKRWGCRCAPCREAMAQRAREIRERGEIPSHGRVGYEYGCRCPECRQGKKESMAALAAARRSWQELHAKPTRPVTIKELV